MVAQERNGTPDPIFDDPPRDMWTTWVEKDEKGKIAFNDQVPFTENELERVRTYGEHWRVVSDSAPSSPNPIREFLDRNKPPLGAALRNRRAALINLHYTGLDVVPAIQHSLGYDFSNSDRVFQGLMGIKIQLDLLLQRSRIKNSGTS